MPQAGLKEVEDKELWLLKDEKCTLPLYLKRFLRDDGKTVTAVWPAMMFMNPASELFEREVLSRSIDSDSQVAFFDSEAQFPSGFEKAQGVTPEYYYVWNGVKIVDVSDEVVKKQVTDSTEQLPMPEVIDEHFLREVARRTQICSVDALKLIWAAIIQVATQWMISYRKPINFGFATIFAVPYRVNWKSVLLGGFPEIVQISNRLKDAPNKMQEQFEKLGVADGLRFRELLEVNGRSHLCGWSLEILPSKMWEQSTWGIEQKRRDYGATAYAKSTVRTILRLENLIRSAFVHYAARAGEPSADFSSVAPKGSQILVPFTRRHRVVPQCEGRELVTISCGPPTAEEKLCFLAAADRAPSKVHPVPDFQSATIELRRYRPLNTGRNGKP